MPHETVRMSNRTYKGCGVGLSGLGVGKPAAKDRDGYGQVVPHSHVPAYAMLPETEIVGVCDLKQEPLDFFKEHWSERFPNALCYTDYKEMLAELRPEIISVVTSDNRHADIVVDAIKAGVKGVYCEKPIATTLADADRMIEAAEKSNVPITVNHSRRWRPIFRPAFDTLEKGAIGELKHIVVNYGGPRAMLFRNGTHMIDTICMFARSDPEWVFAELQEGYEDYWPYKGDGGRTPDLEPGVCGYIHFKNGVRAFYNNNKTMTGVVREWELFGTEGRISVNDKHAELETAAGKKKIDCPHHMLVDSPSAIRELIDVIENGGETCSPPRQARRVLEVLLGFMASQKKGNVRIDFPLDENAV